MAKFECLVSGKLVSLWEWYKDGKKIDLSSRRFVVKLFFQFEIKEVVPEDAGLYVCAAANKYGVTNRTYTLKTYPGIKRKWYNIYF